jgi:hypothetical protein
MSVHKWGESPIGRWTLRVETRQPQNRESRRSAKENDSGVLSYFGLHLYGSHETNADKTSINKRHESNAFVPSPAELEWIYRRELDIRQSPNVIKKRDYQNLIDKRSSQQKNENPSLFTTFRRAFGF